MAAIVNSKRRRQGDEEEDGDIEDEDLLDDSSSASRSTRRGKRVRLSTEDDTGSVESDHAGLTDDEVEEDALERDETYSGLAYEKENEQIDGDQSERVPDIDDNDEVLGEYFRKCVFARPAGENRAAPNGIIEEVVCTNFMCHEHLTIRVGPLINFIIGHNGSGKSAVLTALTICMGGKATSTNRGQNLKSFIKEGKEVASLSVKVKNQGDGAYKPEVFGKSVIVERTFTRSGSSSFKIKNALGKTVTTKRADLDDILQFFALQLDNPMNVLTQDMARQFLNTSSATDKYKFFMKGTQLESLDHDYTLIEEKLQLNAVRKQEQKEATDKQREHMIEKKKRFEMSRQQQTLEDRFNNYGRQMAWVQVEEEEQRLEEIDASLREIDGVIQERTTKAQEASARLEQAERKTEEAQGVLVSLRNDLQQKKQEKAPITESLDARKKDWQILSADQRRMKAQIDANRAQIATFRQEIEQEHARLTAADNGAHARKMEEIQQVKEKLVTAQREKEQLHATLPNLQAAKKQAEQVLERAKRDIQESEGAIQAKRDAISDLQKGSRVWMNAYPQGLSQLLQSISRETRFREKPIGPLGRHIQLLQPKWSSILEASFGNRINGFAVANAEDKSILLQLMKQVGYDGSVFVATTRRIDTSEHEPPAHYLTWLRALKVENDLIRNIIIINHHVEQTLLIEDREEAVRVQRARPKFVNQIYAMKDDRRGGGIRFGYSASGAESASPFDGWARQRMETNAADQATIEEEHLQRLQQAHKEIEGRLREAQNHLREASQAIARQMKRIRDLELEIERFDERQQVLQDELEAETPQTGKIEALEQEIQKTEDAMKFDENQYEDSVNERDRLQRELHETRAQLQAFDDEIEAIERKVAKADLNHRRLEKEQHARVLEKNEILELVKDGQRKKERMEVSREEQQKHVEEFTKEASKVSARVAVDPGETAESIDKKLEKLLAELNKARRENGGSRAELEMAYLQARESLRRAVQTLRGMERTDMEMRKSLVERRLQWVRFRKMIASRARIHFSILLSERQFKGELNIDHEQKTLSISVEPDITKMGSKGRQTKTLSGGEKSFSTICLLLSLWEAMGSPIRCLDEFDVFMDNVNRDVSMRMMIKAARLAGSKQYVLITPQAMGNVQLGPDVKIHKMSDPERGQRALPFERG